MKRLLRSRVLVAIGWLPSLAVCLIIYHLRSPEPYNPFFPYILAAAWFASATDAFFALAITIALTTILNIFQDANPLYAHILAEGIISLIVVIIVTSRSRVRRMENGLRLRIQERSEMIKALQDTQRKAHEALRLRDDFLTAASHDLRTPLTAVMGRAGIMQKRLERGTVENSWLQEQVVLLVHGAKRMARTIDDLTDAAHVQMGEPLPMHLEEIDLGALAREVANDASASEEAQVKIDLPSDPLLVFGDRSRLGNMLQNLIDNALKYNRDAAPISVAIRAEGRAVLIDVQDKGIGIPAEDLPHVFERFYRAANINSSAAGSGIGLATAKAIVDQHGGTIDITSTVNSGTSIKVWLPLAREIAQGAAVSAQGSLTSAD